MELYPRILGVNHIISGSIQIDSKQSYLWDFSISWYIGVPLMHLVQIFPRNLVCAIAIDNRPIVQNNVILCM